MVGKVAPRDLDNILEADINHGLMFLPNWNLLKNVLDDHEITWVNDGVPANIDENQNHAISKDVCTEC